MTDTIQGVDVSNWNANTNWNAVKASGKSFAFIKATEGLTYENPQFKKDWESSKASGLIRGAYHFFHPKDDPVKQANWFFNVVGQLSLGDLPAVLDLETHELTIDQEIQNALIWLDCIEKATGKKPIIYSGKYYIDELKNPPKFANYPLWLADYENTPKIPLPWKGYTFWQYSSGGRVPGVSGNCDLSSCGGDLTWLIEFCNQTI